MSAVGLAERMVTSSQWVMPIGYGKRSISVPASIVP